MKNNGKSDGVTQGASFPDYPGTHPATRARAMDRTLEDCLEDVFRNLTTGEEGKS